MTETLLGRTSVIPVVVVTDADTAAPLARTLLAAGLPMMEVTLRTPAALEAIRRISEEVPEMAVGAGTVIEATQASIAADCGASFLVSPGVAPALLAAMEDTGLPRLPGVATVSEILLLMEQGYHEFKFFPAEAAGGSQFLKSVHSPVPQARFCPTGGVDPSNVQQYLALPNVPCVGGSWIAPPHLVASRDWGEVAARARAVTALGNAPA